MFLVFSEFVFPFAVFFVLFELFFFCFKLRREYWWMHELERTNKSVRVVDGSLVSFCKHILIKNVQRCQTACFSPFVLLFSFAFVSFVRFSRTYIYICYSVSACSRIRLLPKLYIHMHTTHQLARSSVRLTNRLVAGKSSAVPVPVPVQTIFACVYALI